MQSSLRKLQDAFTTMSSFVSHFAEPLIVTLQRWSRRVLRAKRFGAYSTLGYTGSPMRHYTTPTNDKAHFEKYFSKLAVPDGIVKAPVPCITVRYQSIHLSVHLTFNNKCYALQRLTCKVWHLGTKASNWYQNRCEQWKKAFVLQVKSPI